MEQRLRYYEAADKGRRGKAFRLAKHTGPNAEVIGALSDLRSRSRHMVRNDGWAKRAVEAVVKHTIGEGIRPAPVGTLATNRKVKALWRKWAETTACDWYGKTTFYGLQEQAMRAIVEGGDAIILLRRVVPKEGSTELPIKLQLCEGDLIDHTRNGINEKGVARLGVQFSSAGELMGYWLYDSHPGDIGFYAKGLKQSEFCDKENILHCFEVLRTGQARGVPFGVAAFTRLNNFSTYEDAQLEKQKIAACFAAFITSQEAPQDEESHQLIDRLEPGIIERLGSNEEIHFANPPTVGDYDSYSVRVLQGVAAAYGITYEMLTMDYKRVNFTSGRMAKMDVTGNFRSWQYNMIVPQLCAPVWNWFIDACLMTGLFSYRIEADWTAPRVQQLDPVKETNARLTAVSAGMETLSEVIREEGRDPEEFFDEYKQDIDRLKSLGITLSSVALSPDDPENNNDDETKD
jgi:lambda family phage portal protein